MSKRKQRAPINIAEYGAGQRQESCTIEYYTVRPLASVSGQMWATIIAKVAIYNLCVRKTDRIPHGSRVKKTVLLSFIALLYHVTLP